MMDISPLSILVKNGKIKEADEKLEKIDTNLLTMDQQMMVNNLKCEILIQTGNIGKGILLGKEVANNCKKEGLLLEQVDALILTSEGERLQ